MSSIICNGGIRLLRDLGVDAIKHGLVREMIGSHLVFAHMTSVVLLMEKIKHEVHFMEQISTGGCQFEIFCPISCIHLQFD